MRAKLLAMALRYFPLVGLVFVCFIVGVALAQVFPMHVYVFTAMDELESDTWSVIGSWAR